VTSLKTGLSCFIGLCAIFVASYSWALPPANLAPVPPAVVDSITPTELRMYLDFLASDELGGRYTLSPNFAIAARYLASHLKAYGFQGAGDHGDFLQSFNVTSSKPDLAKCSLAVTLGGQNTNYGIGDFFPSQSSASGEASGQVVFAGMGVSSRSQNHDDYANLDAKGKIVLIVSGGVPQGVDRAKLASNEEGVGAAQAHGAVAVIQIPQQRFIEFMKNRSLMDRFLTRESVHLATGDDAKIPAITLSPDLSEKVLSTLGLNLKGVFEAVKNHQALAPKTTEISAHVNMALQETRTATQNVVGVLPGTDPKLKNEYVVFSAHYDHLKTGPKGEIYHGADDDGSGTSAILAIAHAISLDPPKRSVMIMFHAGEELGLLGSEYNTDVAPAVPLDKIVADLNIDMIGRSKAPQDHEKADEHLSDANTVYLVGADRISKELNEISEQTNADYQKLNISYYYNDPDNPERIYFRSDHWNYAKHGIPVIFYFDGIHVDYHKPTDTVDKIDFTKMTQITRLVFETGWRLANLDHELSKSN
jgi:peptidase M28-like protein